MNKEILVEVIALLNTANYDTETLNHKRDEVVNTLKKQLHIPVVSVPLPSRKDYDNRKLKPMYFKKDTTVDNKVLYVKGEEYQPYNWNYGRMIGYWHTGRLGYER